MWLSIATRADRNILADHTPPIAIDSGPFQDRLSPAGGTLVRIPFTQPIFCTPSKCSIAATCRFDFIVPSCLDGASQASSYPNTGVINALAQLYKVRIHRERRRTQQSPAPCTRGRIRDRSGGWHLHRPGFSARRASSQRASTSPRSSSCRGWQGACSWRSTRCRRWNSPARSARAAAIRPGSRAHMLGLAEHRESHRALWLDSTRH
jgi:hypothetical protein